MSVWQSCSLELTELGLARIAVVGAQWESRQRLHATPLARALHSPPFARETAFAREPARCTLRRARAALCSRR